MTPTPVAAGLEFQEFQIDKDPAGMMEDLSPASDWQPIQIRYSHYWPLLGGVNTSMPHAPHLARTANGDRWQDWVGVGVACPREWPFGTQLKAFGQTWVCVDRGGMIRYVDGVPWVDFLVETPHRAYGEFVDIHILEEPDG